MNTPLSVVKLAVVAPIPLLQAGMAHFIQNLDPPMHLVVMVSSLEQLLAQWAPPQIDLLAVVLSGSPQEIARDTQQLLVLSERAPALRIVVCTYCRDIALLTRLNLRPHISLLARQESQEQTRRDMAQALTGAKVCSPSMAMYLLHSATPAQVQDSLVVLTQAEHKVLEYLQQGMSVSDVADLLHRSVKTISAHKCNSMRKLGVRNDAELFQHLRSQVTDTPYNTPNSPWYVAT
ncbi:LuxR C-terminal-related transcriptional regulator [Serratia fonticola]|uniref:helix-turn-helix transcriptional regulator n=1 Tax=Serratia fonticola TaxID=47917 RepID=UPI003AACA920